MHLTPRSASIVFFGLLTLGTGCGSGSSDAGREGGTDGSILGGAGGHTSGSGSAPLGSGGQSSGGGPGGASTGGNPGTGGGGAAGGASVGGASLGGNAGNGGMSTGGSAGSGGRSTAGNTASGGKSTGGGGATGGGSTSTGGNAGSGGRSTAGNTGSGGAGSGGTNVAGNTGSGGGQTGGSGGSAKLDGGVDLAPAPDATADTARPDAPADLAQKLDTSGSNTTLDACFADLPAAVGTQMVATKQSSDNRVRIRIALDTEGRMGTSGSYGWLMIRLAVEVDGQVTCIKDRANLKYTGSLHNCTDEATATSGSTKYSFKAPDRSQTEITIEGSEAANGTWTLTDTTCNMTGSMGLPTGCRSGGPC